MFAWLRDLLALFSGGQKATPVEPPKPEEPVKGEPEWLKLARAELGTKEVVGSQHNPTILGYFRDAGFPEIDNDETAWCAGFCNAMLERSGNAGSKSLAARSFLNWGNEVKKPYPGCIAVLSRGNPRGWQGHVGIWLGESDGMVTLLGGNQGNEVSIARYPKSQLLGYREPFKASKSRTMKASTLQMGLLGLDSAVILESQSQIGAIGDLLGQIGVTIPQFLLVSFLLKIALCCVVIYARQEDAQKKGR